MIWLAGFTEFQPSLGYFMPKSVQRLTSQIIQRTKMYLHNHSKQVNPLFGD